MQSKREFYRVKESRRGDTASADKQSGVGGDFKQQYYYDVLGDHCWCFFYAKQCLTSQGSSLLCKHVLAVKLARALSEAHPDKLTIK